MRNHHVNLGFIKRNFYRCNRDMLLKYYLTLLTHVLEYAYSVWDPSIKENIDKLEQIKNELPDSLLETIKI